MFFFPLRDDNPTATKPYLVWALIALCGVVFLWQLGLAEDGRRAILAYGVTPATLIGGAQLPAEINQIPPIMTVFTSMFMHGGVMHLLGTCCICGFSATILRKPLALSSALSVFILFAAWRQLLHKHWLTRNLKFQ